MTRYGHSPIEPNDGNRNPSTGRTKTMNSSASRAGIATASVDGTANVKISDNDKGKK